MGLFIGKKRILFYLFLFVSLGVAASCQDMRNQAKKQIQYRQANKAHDEGDYPKAIRIYKKLIEEDPSNGLFEYDLGMAYLDSKDFPAVTGQIKRLKEMDRDDLADQLNVFRGEAKDRAAR